jgi:hypothetical protein
VSGTIPPRMAGRLRHHPPLPPPQSLLLIILDDLRRANFRFVRIKPDVAKGTSLAQEVPALIQFDLDLREPFTIGLVECRLLVQSVFLCGKVLNMIEDRLISDLILHESLLQRGCDRNGQALMLRPPETAVNRCSGQHDNPGVGCQKKKNVPETISPRVAGILSSWFPWSISFVWFDERKRQDRPAYQIDCLWPSPHTTLDQAEPEKIESHRVFTREVCHEVRYQNQFTKSSHRIIHHSNQYGTKTISPH